MTTFLLIVLVGSFVLAGLRPKLGGLALLLLAPWAPWVAGTFVPISKLYFGVPLSPLELMVAALWARYLIQIVRARRLQLPRFMFAIIVLFFFIVLQTFRSMLTGVGDWGGLLRGAICLSGAVPVYVLGIRLPRRNGLLVLTLVFFIGSLLIGLYLGVAHSGVALTEAFVINRSERFLLTFVFNIIISIALFDTARSVKTKALQVISFTGVLLSLGRSFWVAAVAQIILGLRRHNHISRVGVFIALAIVVVAAASGIVEQRGVLGARSADYRILEATEVIRHISFGDLLIGHGLGAPLPFELAMHFHNPAAWWIHNEWLLMLYNGGLPLVASYAWVMASMWRFSRKLPRFRALTVALLATSVFAGQLLTPAIGPWLGAIAAQDVHDHATRVFSPASEK